MKKYSVFEAVWLAAALLTIEKYEKDTSIDREGVFFKQSDIVHLAETLTDEKVDPARVSWWANADNEKATRNYFRSDSAKKPSAKRLSMLDEFPEKLFPENLNINDEVGINGKQYTIGRIMDFLQDTYPALLERTDQEYDVQAIMNALKEKEEMDPDKHDGCYELMRETINAYSKLQDFSILDYKDLNLVYFTTVGTFRQKFEIKKNNVAVSHLNPDDKKHLVMLWDEIWERARQRKYSNYEPSAKEGQSIGLFGTGFLSFKGGPTPEQVQSFIRMCIDILQMTDDEEMFDRAAMTLSTPIRGMQAAAASMILHCLKPYTFPVLNANSGFRNIFEVIGVQLTKPSSLDTYIKNCRRIKAFRDQNFSCKNYRIYDIAARNLEDYYLSAKYGKFDSWEILSEHVARKICDKSFFQYKWAGLPRALRWFFEAEGINIGDRVDLVLKYEGFEYDAQIQKTDNGADQTRIFWDAALKEEFESFANDGKQHALQFTRSGDHRYDVEFLELKDEKKTWLLIWNKDKWNWDGFADKCEATKSGQTYIESWACSNTNPKNGDEVYLIKLGKQPRGLIGHGIVVRESYEKDHFDTLKVAEGKKEKAIDVQFDRLINYEKDKYIQQGELVAKCGAQHWSPQNSGIEIKQEVLPTLRMLWSAAIKDPNEWWPSLSEYDPGITADQYEQLLKKKYTGREEELSTIYFLYKLGGNGSINEILRHYSGKYSGENFWNYSFLFCTMYSLVHYVVAEVKYPEPFFEIEDKNYKWYVLFYRKKNKDDQYWKLREPLEQAIRSLEKDGFFDKLIKGRSEMEIPYDHNMILYGPPGTGKTYNSVIYAVAICEGKNIEDVMKKPYPDILIRYRELQDSGRIAFTTFHQSYGYEEFIEGIKPKLNSESETLGYTIEDGIFKDFCNRAKVVKVQAIGGSKMKQDPRIWGMILGGTGKTDLKKKCFANNEIRLGWSEVDDEDVEGDFLGDENVSWNAKHMVSDFKNTMEVGDLVVIEKNNKSIDAIGVITGEYVYDDKQSKYPRSRSVEWLVKDIDQDMIPFLPNGRKQLSRFSLFAFDYIGMEVISQILNENSFAPIVEVEQETKPYVFIIDEINRGNISKIFGELITLIEDTKRAGASEAMEATLPYSGEPFSVPKNVYILGTMNTADRSIALMDTALRRRFEFTEMMPNSEVLERLGVGTIAVDDQELNVSRMLDVINERIEYLFDREHTIGHAFFTKLADDPSLETLAGIFEKNVIPLLQEYFYEDYEKIQLVLGDNAKEDEFKFVVDKPLKIKDIFSGNPDIDLPEKGYAIQREAFYKLESYKQIGKDL